ncbi:phenazine biosynthesis protein PhzF family [Gulbenkiania indica]|uniref:Phenazine biosynthesis protein PhzF family n=1 Tax=Gulbenkiania indica TaxID=375574 RepID=A0A0K6H851_9NEIS|nr:PhzF family phenazine biosynthesis protein [Gulbenkiania indica]CUA86938.1 phenazine biosynthesis protein PhzF family [Gulbenkiania indica]
MPSYRYHLVNVFAETPFGGNPLAVFPDASGLDTATMQAIACQMNLSETVFVFPAPTAAAALRIFTPRHELPFAGHPTLGSAAVLHRLHGLPDAFSLVTQAGTIPIVHQAGRFTLTAPQASQRSANLSQAAAAEMLGLAEEDLLGPPVWLNAGSEQMLVRAASRAAVLRARPEPLFFRVRAQLYEGRSVAYLWHVAENVATVRLFYDQHGVVLEDPGTGSACANLGGWCALNGLAPLSWRVEQGEAIGRPNVLYLDVSAEGVVTVGGKVWPVGEGVLFVPEPA